LLAVLITSLFLTFQINSSLAVSGDLGTQVAGTLTGNTTWTVANSPYIITSTVIVPSGVNLTIEPGVTVTAQTSDNTMFKINGLVQAKGSATAKIIFDGNGNMNFFKTNHPVSAGFLDLDFCVIENGLSAFWFDNTAYLNITNSTLSNLSEYSYLWYPSQDSYIEYNTFTNCSGIKIGTDDYFSNSSGLVYIKYNFFANNQGFIVNNFASYGLSKVCVNYNSFTSTSGLILEVEQTSTTADMDASQNYWGTTNITDIDFMIYDKNDDPSCSSGINYLPILDNPDPQTPVAPTPTPTPSPTLEVTPLPTPLPSISPDPSISPSPTTEPTTSPTPSSSPINSSTPEPTTDPTNTNLSSIPTQDQPSTSISTQSLPTQQPNVTNIPTLDGISNNYIQIIIVVAVAVLSIGLIVAFIKRKR